MSIFEKIDELRKKENLSFNALEKRCGLARQTIEKWKFRIAPSASALVKLARYFNVTTDYLLGLSDNPTSCKFCTNDYND